MAQTESYSFLIGILIAALIIGAFVIGFYQAFLVESSTEKCFTNLINDTKNLQNGQETKQVCQAGEDYFFVTFNKDQKKTIGAILGATECTLPEAIISFETGLDKPEMCNTKNCLCMCEITFTKGTGQIGAKACLSKKAKCETFENVKFAGKCMDQQFFMAGPRTTILKIQKEENTVGICFYEEGGRCIYENFTEATQTFTNLIKKYEKCKSHTNNKCVCEQTSYETLPKKYTIKITNEENKKTKFDLVYEGRIVKSETEEVLYEERILKSETVEDDEFCWYNHKDDNYEMKETSDGTEITIPQDLKEEYAVSEGIQLFKFNKTHTCLAQKAGRREFQMLTEYACGTKNGEEAKTAFLDIGQSDEIGDFHGKQTASTLLEHLDPLLTTFGRSVRITYEESLQGRLDRRTAWFNKLYTEEADNFLHDNLYIISIAAKYKKLEESEHKQDHFIIHYLETSSASKNLGEKVKNWLEEISGKYYKDGITEFQEGEVEETYKMNTKVLIEKNSELNPGLVFLACQEDYENFPACKEKNEIPAIFIEAVEVYGDGAYMFEGHNEIITQKIFEGVKDFLQSTEETEEPIELFPSQE